MKTETYAYVRLMRPSQWVKNVFVFAPLVFSGSFTDVRKAAVALAAFLYFTVASSIVYIFNDLQDVDRDRDHPVKSRLRPLASGTLSKGRAILLMGFLCLILLSCLFLDFKCFLVISSYVILNIFYSLWLKHVVIVDIFCIALGFLLRVWAGGVAIGVPISSWMFVSVLCLSLYLGSLKRLAELRSTGTEVSARSVLKYYSKPLLVSYVQTAQTAAIVFYGLFVVTERPTLWITLPVVIYAFFRYQYLTSGFEKGETPGEIIFRDRYLVGCVIIWLAICLVKIP